MKGGVVILMNSVYTEDQSEKSQDKLLDFLSEKNIYEKFRYN